jgi:probable HAF family extracellular repeat protein
MNSIVRIYCVCALSMTGPCIGVYAESTYTAVDLGTLGGSSTVASAINSAGVIVGGSYTVGNAEYHAFRYESGVMTDLGTLGGNYSLAFDINDTGAIVGYSARADGVTLPAFRYESGVMQDLGTLGGTQSSAGAINEAGEVVGGSSTANNVFTRACRFSSTGPVSLNVASNLSGASDVNDAGVIVGSFQTAGELHAFRLVGQQFSDLGTIANFDCSAGRINDAGTIIGTARVTNGMLSYSFKHQSGVMSTELGNFGGLVSSASDINSHGAIVGWASLPDGRLRAYLNENGVDYDLNSLVDLPGVTLTYGRAINDRGQIVASGSNNRSYLLTPKSGGRLVNLSVRGPAGRDESSLIGGFVIEGAGRKTVLIRVAGPALRRFGVTPLPDPVLTLHDRDGSPIATNDNWNSDLAATFLQVGAFAWDVGSTDAAIVIELPTGQYTVVVRNGDTEAVQEALIEVYDVYQDHESNLVNVSCRSPQDTATPIILGAHLDRTGGLLIRNGGPGLRGLGVTTAAEDTRLEVYRAGTRIISNDSWDLGLVRCFTETGAYGFAPSSKDAAVFVRTPPIEVTVHCFSVGTTGVGLCELYTTD